MTDNPAATLALVGPGRAGLTVTDVLAARGVDVVAVAGRGPDAPSVRAAAARYGARAAAVGEVGRGAEMVILAVPDGALATVAAATAGSLDAGALVIHLSGALGLDVFDALSRSRPDVGLGSLHPLQSLPSPEAGARRLAGSWAAVDGPARLDDLARTLGCEPFRVDPRRRAAYHAAACTASNHLVALLGQVRRLAAVAGAPAEAFWPLVSASVENVRELGPEAALTGPVARGDHATVAAHLAALPEGERGAYRTLALEALRIARPGPDRSVVEAVLAS